MSDKPLTGHKVLMIVVGSFGVIIAVNLFMAFQAISTFPGLEVRNSYVASQSFDDDRAAQEALQWDVSAVVSDGQLILSINGADGVAVRVAELTAILGRATHANDDVTPDFTHDGTAYVAPVDIAKGNWNLRLSAVAQDGTTFNQRIVIFVKN